MNMFSKLFLFTSSVCSILCENPLVELPIGKISGSTQKTIDGRQFYAFEGIPYAKPPIGDLRFEPPQEVEGWNGTLEANKIYTCLQFFQDTESITGQEDCLYLNVYTLTLDKNAKYDVIIYIHGGAFMFSYGGMYKPTYILNRNVVFVNFNYRLGPLGFLSTEDDVVPGNMGLKDQILLLKWIQKYISYFGGNPKSVTIAGTSAGSASVQLHSLIPASKGLYHRAISESGSALNPWTIMEAALEKTREIGSSLNCPSSGSTKDLIACLKQVDGHQFVGKVKLFQPWLYNPFSPFAVVVDSFSSNPLFEQHPYVLIKNRKFINDVPFMVSFTNSEGVYPVGNFYTDDDLKYIQNNWNFVMPFILHYNFTVAPNEQNSVSEKIRKHYFGNETVSKKTFQNLIQMASDRLFRADIEKALKLYPKYGNTYVLKFEYRGKHSFSEHLAHGSTKNFGASHEDDTAYVLDMGVDTQSDATDRRMSHIMINLWVTFAKNGVPQLGNKNLKPGSRFHYTISGPTKFLEKRGDFGQEKFWNSLPFMENDKLVDK